MIWKGFDRNQDFSNIKKNGLKFVRSCVVVYSAPSSGGLKLALRASRAVGGAVQRNRAKRRLRSVLKSAPNPIPCSALFLLRMQIINMPYRDIERDIQSWIGSLATNFLAE